MFKQASPFKSIAALQNRALRQLQGQIATQQQLTQLVKAALPEVLAKQVLHCVLKNTNLLLYTPSANWASQLRFYSRVVIEAAAGSSDIAITTVQIRVLTKSGALETNTRKANIPSAEKLEFLRMHSNSIRDDQLKSALLKLSNTLTQLSSRKP